MAVDPTQRPAPVGARGGLVLAIVAACVWAVWQLDLRFAQLIPDPNRLRILQDFFAAALTPSFDREVVAELGRGTWKTVSFAVLAMLLALQIGIVLGFAASTAWWSEELTGRTPRILIRTLHVLARLLVTLFRSVHELFWAVVLLVSMGATNPLAGIVAIAIPYGCTLAKVFSEMVDEAPRGSAIALRVAGASSMQVYCFGLLPRAFPDMTAYAFYRFECTLRSATILGFFGFETLGLFIKETFGEAEYDQTWTFLYALLALIIAADWWSGAFRRSSGR